MSSTPRVPKTCRSFARPLGVVALAIVAAGCDGGGSGGGAATLDAEALRDRIAATVGNLERLRVPADDAAIPQPLLASGTPDRRFAITEDKRVLGQQLFFDPVRSNAIRPELGGDPATAQSASCGSCHLGETAGKAGQAVNFGVGAEGRGYRDSLGDFHPDRRLRDGLVDAIPTPIERFEGDLLVASGKFDAVDSVPRLSPSMIGFAFNNRLLLGGKAGQRRGEGPGAENPANLPAGENLAEIAFGAHRMLATQAEALLAIPVYVRLFEEAFPEEAADAARLGDPRLLVNDRTIARAVAAFLRTVVTRDTPWDRFLAGDDRALGPAQRRGAALFVTPADEGGAGCIACHSGPMLNKILGDEDGLLVEENFHNVGVGDHPLQELARAALGDPDRHDVGRAEITGLPEDEFEFRTPTLRQLKDGRQFMHGALFTSVREVVLYFNDGIPASPLAGAALTISPLFLAPRGARLGRGLGLDDDEIDDLVEFLETALYDPGFVAPLPGSPTRPFELTRRDLAYSIHRPDLAALGAIDGRVLSGSAPSNDDALSRLDRGVETLHVTGEIGFDVARSETTGSGRQSDEVVLTNAGSSPIRSPLMVVVSGLLGGAILANADGTTLELPSPGLPYMRVRLDSGWLESGGSVRIDVEIERLDSTASYALDVFSGEKRP